MSETSISEFKMTKSENGFCCIFHLGLFLWVPQIADESVEVRETIWRRTTGRHMLHVPDGTIHRKIYT